MTENPWKEIASGTQRRDIRSRDQDIFFFRGFGGEPGLMIKILRENRKKTDSERKIGNFRLVLKEDFLLIILKEEKYTGIFSHVCEDIIGYIGDKKRENITVSVEKRLILWQEMMKNMGEEAILEEIQRGLFTELIFLKTLLEKDIEKKYAVNSWSGPDKSKQDFIFENTAVEIKSYSSSRGKEITVSSPEQLYSPKENFFIAAWGLSKNEKGRNVRDLYEEIFEILKKEDFTLIPDYNEKVLRYGYEFFNREQKLQNFITDEESCYVIREGFPRINPEDIPGGVKNVKYRIDLTKCGEFRTDIKKITEEIKKC